MSSLGSIRFSFYCLKKYIFYDFEYDPLLTPCRFVLDQHPEFYSASSLKQQSAGRHVAPLRHIILIPSQPGFALSP
jgi:hypothetical protein